MRKGDGEVAAESMELEIRRLYKSFLIMLEDLQDMHSDCFDKLYENLPEEYELVLEQAEFFNEKRQSYYRKKVLDSGNDCLRRLEFVKRELGKL